MNRKTKTYKTYKYQVKEVEGAKGSAWFTDTKHNVFLDAGDNDFSPEHVRNRFLFSNHSQVWTTIHVLANILHLLNNYKFVYLWQCLNLVLCRQLPTTVASLAYDCLDEQVHHPQLNHLKPS